MIGSRMSGVITNLDLGEESESDDEVNIFTQAPNMAPTAPPVLVPKKRKRWEFPPDNDSSSDSDPDQENEENGT